MSLAHPITAHPITARPTSARPTPERIHPLIPLIRGTLIITAPTILGMGSIRHLPTLGIRPHLGTPILIQIPTGFPTPDGADLKPSA